MECAPAAPDRGAEQIAEADQVVGDHVQTKHRSDLFGAAQFELAQTAPLVLQRRRLCLDPGKHLLDAPAGIDRHGVALVAGGVLGHMRRDADAAHLRLGDLAIHDQGIVVVHEHVAPIARKSRVDVGLAGQ